MNEVKIEVNLDELNIIVGVLRKLPYEQVASLLVKIDSQVQPQLKKEPE
jgi:hypothetical protein